MNLEQLKAETKSNATKKHFCTMLDGKSTVDKTLYEFTEKELDTLIAHTLKQAAEDLKTMQREMSAFNSEFNLGYEAALTDAQELLLREDNENV